MAVSTNGVFFPDHIVADLEREAEADGHIGKALAVDAMLKDLDPRLELVWVGQHATSPGLVPSRWHIRRRNEQTLDSYFPLVGPDDSYVEPNSGHIEMMRRNDLWSRDVVGELQAERRRKEEARRKHEQAGHEERVDTLATHLKSRINPGVSFSDARPWTNRINKLPGA